MLENDGSYEAVVQFTYNRAPSQKNIAFYKAYHSATDSLLSQIEEDNQQYKALDLSTASKQRECSAINDQTQLQTCNQSVNTMINGLNALQIEEAHLSNAISVEKQKYIALMAQDYFPQCGADDIGGDLLETYGTEQTATYQETLSLIKTDKGWVINSILSINGIAPQGS